MPTVVSPRTRLHQSQKPNGPPTDPCVFPLLRYVALRGRAKIVEMLLRGGATALVDAGAWGIADAAAAARADEAVMCAAARRSAPDDERFAEDPKCQIPK